MLSSRLWAAMEFQVSQQLLDHHPVVLNGTWLFHWNALLPPDSVADPAIQWQTVTVPGIWNDVVSDKDPMNHGVATYATQLNFEGALTEPVVVRLIRISEAFHFYLVSEDGQNIIDLFEGGEVSADPRHNVIAPDYLSFALPPVQGRYWLVLQVSKFNFYKGGLRTAVTIDLRQRYNRNRILVVLLHGIAIGALLYMALNHLQIYLNRRQNTSSLLIAVACLFVAFRCFVGFGYLEQMFPWVRNAIAIWRFRLELTTIAIPASIWLHFYLYLFRQVYPQRLLRYSWMGSIVLTLSIFLTPADWLAYLILPAEEVWLVLNMLVILYVLVRATTQRLTGARLSLAIFFLLVVGAVNDLLLSLAPGYGFYVMEYILLVYAVLLFLLVHSQLLARQFANSVSNEIRLLDDNRKLVRQREQAELAAIIDHLTGVLNRKGLEQRLERAWNRCIDDHEVISVLLIDADHFKKLNDQYGHLIGDQALMHLAKVISMTKLRIHDFIGRWGGEEFMVVVPGADIHIAAGIAETIRASIEHSEFGESDLDIRLTVSIGVAGTRPGMHKTSLKQLIQLADEALYAAKSGGRNRVEAYLPTTTEPPLESFEQSS
ncbi:sensor domain-containing diguanylate cyclase [Gynuella sunshinyii]|uniref:sensor domain-containing diguanylate cyclase n=1 Tax=Gynuella sunshinyii TaxID=1445505 RepID=UPI0014701933|nr:diguanylate cyclase [Gynuella sunshinyii]